MDSNAESVLTVGAARVHLGFETFRPDYNPGDDHERGVSGRPGDLSQAVQAAVGGSRSDVERDILVAVFERLPWGVIIVDAKRSIIAANQIGQEMLADRSNGLRIHNRRLEPTHPQQAVFLRKLIASACSIQADATCRTMLLFDGAERATFSLAISPLNAPGDSGDDAGGRAVIFMRALSLSLPSSFSGQLQTFFGLSAKEARLATMLAEGCALKEAAGLLGVRFATARSYLESIFQKTSVNRQGQLVALLRTVQPLE